MAEVQHVSAGACVLYFVRKCTAVLSAPACFFLLRVPIRQAARAHPIQSRQGCSPKAARVQNAEMQTESTECRVQDADRMQTVLVDRDQL